mmetsp:Transcript_7345/g.8431  ORF Transcript_7345/g.8431 Transcript_7345/m.8431 type:complete len:350 (-) Transcript_7345:857-1906(-)
MAEKAEKCASDDVDAKTVQKQKELTSKDYYFDSYAHFGIHEEMLKDEVRTRTYMNSIIQNKHLFKDKVVLDVGCGTGILSMFAAQAGAKAVYGVDCSTIADQAKAIVKANGLADVVTIIQGKIEEVTLPVDKVDIIVSEWMGYFLLYESMLDSVLFARDKWLKPDGLVFPDKASMYICGLEDGEYKQENIHFWDRVYGFDMSCIKKMALMEPLVETVDFEQVMSNVTKFATFDIKTMEKDSVDFDFPFEIEAKRNDYCHAFVVFFDVEFSACHKYTAFSTGPEDTYTHWKQSIIYLQEDLTCNTGDKITGRIKCTRNKKNVRDLDILLDYKIDGEVCQVDREQDFYRMR